MADPGFEEERTPYSAEFDPNTMVGLLRSIGPDGPTYEVVKIVNSTTARICVLETEREVNYDIADVLKDPAADAAWKTKQ